MKTYRTIKPILVEAVQLKEPIELKIATGTVRAKAGDWLIRGANGEYYPCSNAEFNCTYEQLDTPNFPRRESLGKECGC